MVSPDGSRWTLPGGRAEPGETAHDALVREVAEEACATVTRARLLGYARGTSVAGPELGLVLVRAMWLAEVVVEPWSPRFEMTHRELVPAAEAFGRVEVEAGQEHIYRRHFLEAGLPVD